MFLRCALCLLLLCSCYRVSNQLEPRLCEPIHPKALGKERKSYFPLPEEFSCTLFSPLNEAELQEEWGKEHQIGLYFAADFDLFRAITAFKRALFLLTREERRAQIEYEIALAYYLGEKYMDVVSIVERGPLAKVSADFPAFQDLLLILYDSYHRLGREREKEGILCLIETQDACVAEKLKLYDALSSAQFETLQCYPVMQTPLATFALQQKSIRKAELYNALLPGAGYWYVGQRNTAVTAFLVNSLFIAASAIFFEQHNIAAGLITLSLETGWYFGGIYGGGLAAKCYNESLYNCMAEKVALQEKLYPVMSLRYCF